MSLILLPTQSKVISHANFPTGDADSDADDDDDSEDEENAPRPHIPEKQKLKFGSKEEGTVSTVVVEEMDLSSFDRPSVSSSILPALPVQENTPMSKKRKKQSAKGCSRCFPAWRTSFCSCVPAFLHLFTSFLAGRFFLLLPALSARHIFQWSANVV